MTKLRSRNYSRELVNSSAGSPRKLRPPPPQMRVAQTKENQVSLPTICSTANSKQPNKRAAKQIRQNPPPSILNRRLQIYLKLAFDRLDLDHSGSLSRQEIYPFLDVLKKHNIDLTRNDLDMIFMYFDSNRDGVIKRQEVEKNLKQMENEIKVHKDISMKHLQHPRRYCLPPKCSSIYMRPQFTPVVPKEQKKWVLLW